MRDRMASAVLCLLLLTSWADLVCSEASDSPRSYSSLASSTVLSSYALDSSDIKPGRYPAGNTTTPNSSGTGISSFDSDTKTKITSSPTTAKTSTSNSGFGIASNFVPISSPKSNSSSAGTFASTGASELNAPSKSPPIPNPNSTSSSLITPSGPFNGHISFYASSGAHAPLNPSKGTGTAGRFPTGGAGAGIKPGGLTPSNTRGLGTGFRQATRTAGIFFSDGSHASSGTIKSAGLATGFSHVVDFPQLTGFLKGSRISGSSFGSVRGVTGGYGPSGSEASGSLGGWARNPACTASWNSRYSAANGTVMTTVTYSYTMTLPDKAVNTRLGEVASGPTTAIFNAGTVTYEVGSNDQCCGDCNIRYPNVRVYYWPTNNTNTWCLKGQSTLAPVAQPSQGNQILYPGLPSLPKLTDLPSLTSTGPVGETTGAGSDYSGIPPGGFWGGTGGPSKVKPRNDKHPMITAAPELSVGRPVHKIRPREYLPLNGLKGLPKSNDTEPLIIDGKPSNVTLSTSNPSHASGLYKEVIDVIDGMTFVSPTIYVVISTISASNKCGLVGDIHRSLTIPYDKGQLSTVDALGITSSFNFEDLPCPPSSWANPNPLQGNTAALQYLASDYHPTILVPHISLQHLDQAWHSCNIIDVGNGYDPPRQLTPQTVMVSGSPSAATTMCSDGSLADPKRIYQENTKSHCLEAITGQVGNFPIKQPVFKTQEPNLHKICGGCADIVGGPDVKTPATAPLVQVTPHRLNVPGPQFQSLAPALASHPAPMQLPASPPPQISSSVQRPQPLQPTRPVQDAKPAVAPPPKSVVVGGQTIHQGAPPVNIGGQSVALSGENIVVGSSTAPAPVPQPDPTKLIVPFVAGGVILTPAPTNSATLSPPLPVEIAGLTFSAPQAKAQAPSSPQGLSVPDPVVIGGITYHPVAQQPSHTPVTVGGLTFTPIPQSKVENSKQQAPAIGAPGEAGAANIVVGGKTYVTGVTAMPADRPVVENGLTVAPVLAGAAASTPLGVVGGQTILGSASQAVVAGQTVFAGGPPAIVHGTPVSLGSSNIVIGSSTAGLPPSLNEPSALGVVGGQVINGNSQSAVVEGHTISAGGSPVTIEGTPVSLGSTNIVIGSSTAALPSSGAWSGDSANTPLGVVAGQVITGDKSHAVVDGQTILPGSSATISGTPVSLGSANIVIGTDSIPLPSQVQGGISSAGPSALEVSGTTISKGGPPITVSGTRISLGPSGLIVGSSTVPLTTPAQLSEAAGGPPVYSIDGIGVTQGSPAITVSGTRISLGSSNAAIGSNTIAFPSSSVFSVGQQVFTPEAGGFSIDGTTLTPGGPGVTVSGTAISIDTSSDLIFGGSTFALPVGASGNPTLAVAGDILTALPKTLGGGFVVDGQTIAPGAAPKTISGTAVSLNTKSSLIIGSSTVALASTGPSDFYQGSETPLTANGETFTPLGASAVVIDGTTLSISGAAITNQGTVISLASNGLVVGSSTFAYATPVSNTLTPVSNGPISGQGPSPTVFAIDGETFTAEASGLSIAGTEISIAGLPITLNGTVISLASDSIIVGASTIPLASVPGLTAAIDSVLATALPTTGSSPSLLGPAGAEPPKTSQNPKTGAAGRFEVADLGDWKTLLGLAVVTVVIAWLLLI